MHANTWTDGFNYGFGMGYEQGERDKETEIIKHINRLTMIQSEKNFRKMMGIDKND